MVDRLCKKITEHHASLKDEGNKSKFRADYRALVETKFVLAPSIHRLGRRAAAPEKAAGEVSGS
jgi:hypothetical protein